MYKLEYNTHKIYMLENIMYSGELCCREEILSGQTSGITRLGDVESIQLGLSFP
jgi:hypothetical protein